ncbi:hypothetical protein F4782DRAFT_219149 [Xylaria castorea]|nr:hypothetical protein F4782DRAFT_219149 [Xylaria castorea]
MPIILSFLWPGISCSFSLLRHYCYRRFNSLATYNIQSAGTSPDSRSGGLEVEANSNSPIAPLVSTLSILFISHHCLGSCSYPALSDDMLYSRLVSHSGSISFRLMA